MSITDSLNVNVSIMLEMLHRILLLGNVTETHREKMQTTTNRNRGAIRK
jgi:hypothetical protein